MTPALRVLNPGPHSSLQDLGRPGYQRMGVARGGALDGLGARAANALVGNRAGTGVVECILAGFAFALEAEGARVAFFGGRAPVRVRSSTRRDIGPAEVGRTMKLSRGDVVEVGTISSSSTLYMAVEGGFRVAPRLGSVSTDLRGGFGGFEGRLIKAGDLLPLALDDVPDAETMVLQGVDLAVPGKLRVVEGPQAGHFSIVERDRFFSSTYALASSSNRMAAKLVGPVLAHAGGFNIVSDGMVPGSIQVPGDGSPIVLRSESQTTGGYPKIGVVISADLPALGRAPVGAA
ncbi:MAG: biotin-dependent carboxyltransferase family protein, partial [Hyphomicrobiales bacterium]|nr:biotin-dependent carboxyltransferase family protein [Hyphomicrobiales bacterium]